MSVTHVIMVGPDWWGCTCGDGGAGALGPSIAHSRYYGVDIFVVSWPWSDVSEIGASFVDRHRWLQGRGAL